MVVNLTTAMAALSQDGAPAPAASDSAATSGGTTSELNLDMKLDDLARQDVVVPGFSQEVSTVERQTSTIGRTPAAVFVITPEMIKRSGARSIPDVLRMAPGVDVARIDAHTWAISIRGFNSRFANKLLVQIDGRIVYNATFGGVYWDQQDVLLADVERIEVIRGPGTTMWGSNAVNGVINILTKKSSDTQGILVQSGGGGQDQQDFNTIRYGGKAGEDLTYRIWAQQFDRAPGWSDTGVRDGWRVKHGGFRMDYTPTEEDTFTLQGDLMSGFGGQSSSNLAIPTPPFSGTNNEVSSFPAGNILGQYERVIDEDTSWKVLGYYDRYEYNRPGILLETRDTYNIDIQYQFSPAEFHHFITGANYRNSPDVLRGSFQVSFDPPRFTTEWASVFAQDTMTLEEDRWYFTLGARLEQNTFGGFQPEPTARLLFLPSERQSMWMAVSRAARNPDRINSQFDARAHIAPPNVPVFLNLLGNPDMQAENLVAYEIGYRAAPTDTFSWDIAGYINDYHKLIELGPFGTPIVGPGGVTIPAMFENNTRALTYGFETTANYQVHEQWRLFASYSVFEAQAQSSETGNTAFIEGNSPHNMVYLRSSWDLGKDLQFDLIGRYVDRLSALDVPKYFQMDARIGWYATKNLEISFVGQNLLDGHHPEFVDALGGLTSTEVRRSWYGMISWTY